MPTATWKVIRFLVLFFRRLKIVQTAGTGKTYIIACGGRALKQDMRSTTCSRNNYGLIAAAILSVGAQVAIIPYHRMSPRKDHGSISLRRSNAAQAERCSRAREFAGLRQSATFPRLRGEPSSVRLR